MYLFAALYSGGGGSPCGAATDPRFKGFTQLVVERVRLAADATLSYPPAGGRWQHRYDAADVGPGPQVDEWCVFVAQDDDPPHLEWLAYEPVPLSTRQANRPPEGRFTVSPESPRAAQDAGFLAEGEDADDDPLRFRWDFGHANASGRAVADGAVAFHAFYPEGAYVVTLFASDGIDESAVAREVVVLPEDEAPPASPVASQRADEKGTPGPTVALVVLILVGAALRRPRARP